MLNPVGPEEPSTYWRRRAIVGVGLLVALWLVWWLFSSVFGSDDEPATPTGPSTPVASGTPTPAPSATATGSPAAAAKASTRADLATCADADVVVAVRTAGSSTPVGTGMKLTMSVTNAGSTPCKRNVGPSANEVRVVSGSVLVWSSDFCSDAKGSKSTVLSADETWTTTVTWPGKVTASDCPADQPTAQPGSYRAVASNGKADSAEAAFQVG